MAEKLDCKRAKAIASFIIKNKKHFGLKCFLFFLFLKFFS
ncbi:hypothetical protein HMPREF0204_12093 [Chryseobacterium gleum ATCC 35910]|uniref:Uncharacterized protein n=1 Tax=Chryseobacterium gleum ATCC 35910 TaxID=525257 RepID=A0ABP2IP01_CHRGE|nr:hypothetical protein HMPREF0204_12093 [Chryseobacterium gleum ATCC 35910]